mmetsp:Transcript_16403/g.33694  ORF Transcript_16403/g.33694 Transcript_16403/m.33694 type:complete len:376 (+) Transcript_16403:1093-2220(+)
MHLAFVFSFVGVAGWHVRSSPRASIPELANDVDPGDQKGNVRREARGAGIVASASQKHLDHKGKHGKVQSESKQQRHQRHRRRFFESRVHEPVDVLGTDGFVSEIILPHEPRKDDVDNPVGGRHRQVGKLDGNSSQERYLQQGRKGVEVVLELVPESRQVVGFSALFHLRPDGVGDRARDEHRKGSRQLPRDERRPQQIFVPEDKLRPFRCCCCCCCCRRLCHGSSRLHRFGSRQGDNPPQEKADSQDHPAPGGKGSEGADALQPHEHPPQLRSGLVIRVDVPSLGDQRQIGRQPDGDSRNAQPHKRQGFEGHQFRELAGRPDLFSRHRIYFLERGEQRNDHRGKTHDKGKGVPRGDAAAEFVWFLFVFHGRRGL